MGSGAGENGEILEWAVASVPLEGQQANGDLHVVRTYPGGALVGAIDALGHGPDAELAAQRALVVFAASPEAPIGELIRRCHQSLTGGRGVVVSLASFDRRNGLMTWAGVGNVEGVLVRAGGRRPLSRSGLVTIGGIVGSDLPEVRPQQLPVEPGDLLVFGTDGVRREFVDSIANDLPVDQLASTLLSKFSKGTDDALVLVVRYRGGAP